MIGIISLVKQKENEIVSPAIYEAFAKHGYSKEWVDDPLNEPFIKKISVLSSDNSNNEKSKTSVTKWVINGVELFETTIIRKLCVRNNTYDVEIKIKDIKNIEEK